VTWQLHERGIALSNAGKSHAQSAHAAREEIRRVIQELKAALDARAVELEQTLNEIDRVRIVKNLRSSSPPKLQYALWSTDCV